MMLPWDDLQSFLAIARHGTLSAAARALGVTQTTMGRRLTAMEGRAGARLLSRTPGGFVLTPAGEAVMGNVERIEAEALAVERRITGRDIRLEGVVRVTSVEILAVDVLTEVARFLATAFRFR
jgi:DNA-binding transcriptional LysR family regulator